MLIFVNSFWLDGGPSLVNYQGFWAGSRLWMLLGRSVLMASGATLISVLIGVPYAFCLARTDVPGKKIWNGLIFFPLCIPAYIHAITWIYLMGDRGLLPTWAANYINLPVGGFSIYGLGGSIVVLSLAYFPFVVLLTLCGLQGVDQRLEDAALLNYSSPAVMMKISLPLVRPHIFSGAVFVFLFALFDYGVPALLRIHTYPVEIFAQFSAFYNEAGAAAHALPLVILAAILLWLQRRAMGNRAYVTMDTGWKNTTLFQLGRMKSLVLIFLGGTAFFSVVLPLITLLNRAGLFQSYSIALHQSAREIMVTIGIAAIAATVIVVLSYILATIIETRHYKGRALLDYLTFLPLAFPAVMIGIGSIYFWNRPWTEVIYQTSLILIVVYAARFAPLAVRAISAGLRQVGPTLVEAAMLCDGKWRRRWWKIELPLAVKGLAAGWIIVFFLCMGELGSTLLVIPPGQGSIALKIYTLMHYGANQLVAALSLILVAINLIAAAIIILLFRRSDLHRIIRAG